MGKQFFYKRETKKKVKEKNTEGVEKEVEKIEVWWDCFNVDCVIRGFWRNDGIFLLLLNDGHEQAEDRQKPIFKNGKPQGYEVKRERDWFFSQIELTKEDAIRFRDFTSLGGPNERRKEIAKDFEKVLKQVQEEDMSED